MEEEMAVIGNRLKELRIMNNYTQKQVADYLKVDQGHLSNIERGKRNSTIDLIEKLCDLYNCSIDFILGESDRYEVPKIAFRGTKKNKNLTLIAKMNEIMKNLEFLRDMEDSNE